jgi:protein-S-isoprenylcysteine O-methyltransferase Ste14
MLKLPPPAWAFLYLIIAGAVSWLYPWRLLLDLRIVWLGVALVAIGFAISVWAFLLFRSEGSCC